MCVVVCCVMLRWLGTILARAPHVLYPGSGIDPARAYDVMLTDVPHCAFGSDTRDDPKPKEGAEENLRRHHQRDHQLHDAVVEPGVIETRR